MSKTVYLQIEVVAYTQAVPRLFWYSAEEEIDVGRLCMVPFGKRQSIGIVRFCQSTKPKDIKGIKPIIKILDNIAPIPKYLLDTAAWLKEYYVASSYAVWTTLLPSGIKAKARKDLKLAKPKSLAPINKLTTKQAEVLEQIAKAKNPSLLSGVTGSGKTEIYLHAIYKVIKQKQSAILLVPEIMLTTQLAQRLKNHFGNVLIVHSGISPVERKQIWLYCLLHSQAGEPIVIVGARSALWMPLHNLGLIIIDEEHEPSYKQESFLRYSTVHVAGYIARSKPAQLILGSATPSVTSYFLAEQNKLNLVQLHTRHNSNLPNIKIIDKSSFNGNLSAELTEAIGHALTNKKQVLLFINRRGSASSMICESCGHVARCPNCDISLSFHGDIARLLCHYCGYKILPPTSCPECKGEMKFVGSGTQKLEAEVRASWPKARIARIDRDNATPEYMQTLYKDMQAGQVDIVIGTQMISRGLDIANLTLVGIVDADTSLAIADFTSSERTFQLISQTAGRAGRRAEVGTVIVQSRNTSNVAIVAAAEHNYDKFYQAELASRARYAYPPYVYLLKLWYGHNNNTLAKDKAQAMAAQLVTNRNTVVLGPVPAVQKRQNGKYVWQIIVKAKVRSQLIYLITNLDPQWQFELDPITLI
jgi:primosomal protein N' (replication factor Y)